MSFTKRLGCSSSDPPNHPPSDLAQEFTTKLLAANSNDAALQADLRSTFQTYNWSSTLAAAILSALENAITAGKTMGPAMKSAYEDAVTAVRRVKAWADAHPEMAAVVVTFIALGILAVMVPWVVGYLGFAEEGIVQGMVVLVLVLMLMLMASLRDRDRC